MHFTAIVNPHNGPGEGALPNENYTQAIRTLNSLENVRTIGYVATTWCTKTMSSVLDEIAVYTGWGDSDPSLAMNGIFFDETPTHYTTEYVLYLQTIFRAVHSNRGFKEGFVGKRTPFISAMGVVRGSYKSPKSVCPDIWIPSLYHSPFFQSTVVSQLMNSKTEAPDTGSCKSQS